MLPPTRILAAVDFSDASAKALAYAARLSHLCGAELNVLHVIDPMLAAAATEKGIELAAETKEELAAFCATAPHMPADIRHHVVTGPPNDTILHIAQRESADLIVLGSRGVTLPERVLFGLTTDKILRLSEVSVLVVPDSIAPAAGARRMTFGPIVVGIECAGGAADAARAAQRLAATLGAELRFIHAVSEITTARRWSALSAIATRRACEDARRELKALLQGLSVDPARLDVRVGAVPQLLAEAAADRPDALLVLGRCYGAPGHAGAASIARRVLTLASVPVLMHVSPA